MTAADAFFDNVDVGLLGGLRPLLKADMAQFCEAKGLGEAKYTQLQAVLEMARRHLAEALPERDAMKHPDEVRDYLRARLRDLPYESFVALFLDAQHRVIACEELARGTLDGATVYPREVIKLALKHGAAAVIFAHNHPSGIVEASAADRALTDKLKAALNAVDIRVLDHFIVGEGMPLSFAERGWL